MDSVSEQFLAKVHPVLAAKVREMAAILAKEEIIIRVLCGFRSVAVQDALYKQGRQGRPGNIVTNAQGGQSYHNYGLAVDCAPIEKNGHIDWNGSHPQWKRMEAVGVSLGLESGANWKRIVDAPHFQLTGNLDRGSPPSGLRNILEAKGMEAVWSAAKITAS